MAQITNLNGEFAPVEHPTPSLIGQITQEGPLLPPIERIPTEILDTIFTFIRESAEYSLTINPSIDMSLFLSLSQVCSRWRIAILSQPNMWASISIDTDYVEVECRNIVNAHLRNAGSHPLRIKLAAYPNFMSPRSTFGDNVLRMIFPELQRCEEFTFSGRLSELAQVAPSKLYFTFPHLHSLTTDDCLSALMDGIGLVPPTFCWFSRALKNAPKLATVATPGIVSPQVLPCRQLTTIYGGELEIAQLVLILRSCPNLKNLVIEWIIPDPWPLNVIVHSSLQELSMHASRIHIAKIVRSLAHISFPALRMLKLEIYHAVHEIQDDISPTSAVVQIIQHFSASLRKLVLVAWSPDVYRTFCRDILPICPHLHCFAIEAHPSEYSEDDYDSGCILHLIQSLTITDTSQPFLAPKLTELCVHEYGTRMTVEYAAAFLDMVESRSAGIGVIRLTDAELKYSARQARGDIQPELNHINDCITDCSIVGRIQQLSQKGIRCTIGSS
ncbi:hypothetical protein VNI00_013184 [Paramarasmius palmivorus]|uniref:F-box domain-containing protein n=1 Tax=Paramarasmius palmivorus TaxID=297713 RepID=A0AAW0BZ01_9AGAR